MSNQGTEYAPGIPEKGKYGDIANLPMQDLVTYVLQKHITERSKGRSHYDMRLGTPQTDLFSWALPKTRLPEVGQKQLAIQTELHDYPYGKYHGPIPKGYGAGRVSLDDYGSAYVNKLTKRSIEFTLAHSRVPVRYKLIHIKGQDWLLTNVTPDAAGVPIGDKPSLKMLKDEDLPAVMEHAKEMQAKIGQLALEVDFLEVALGRIGDASAKR